MVRPALLTEPPQRCHACGEFPLYVCRRSSVDRGYLNMATDYLVLCLACYDLSRAAALAPFLPPRQRHAQQLWIDEEAVRVACRRRANRLEVR